MKGSTKKYVDRKCLLYLMKFVLMKKCCQKKKIYIYVWYNQKKKSTDHHLAIIN